MKKGLRVVFTHDKLPNPENTKAELFFDGEKISEAKVSRWHEDKSDRRVAETFALVKAFDTTEKYPTVDYKEIAGLFLTIK